MQNISDRIHAFNQSRLPDMVELKYQAMAENAFRFYRGTNHIFYEDLYRSGNLPVSPAVWTCGDLHLENFGSYKGDNRLVYFDLNDFDEALLAPALTEIARVVTSIFVAFDSLRIEGQKTTNMARLFLKTYAAALARGKADYIEPRTATGIVCNFLQNVSQRKQKDLLLKRTEYRKRHLRLSTDPRHKPLDKPFKRELIDHMHTWLKHDSSSPYNYEIVDAAFRVAGTGSLGLKRYLFLLKSLNGSSDKYMLVDMKEASSPAALPFIHLEQPNWPSEAARVIAIQERMQNRPPALLSTADFHGASYIVQEMQPTEDSINYKLIRKRYRDIYRVITDVAVLTASAQLRSAGRQGSANADELISFGLDETWQEPLLSYATQYSQQVLRDYEEFATAGISVPENDLHART